MKIAINCIFFTPKGGGIKEYIYNLISNIQLLDDKNEYIFYIFKDNLEYWNKTFGYNLNVKLIPFNSKRKIIYAILNHIYWYIEIKKQNIEIFHSPFFHLPFFINVKTIVTVHDLRFVLYPNTYSFKRYLYLKYVVPISLKKADKIITISNFTKNEIINNFKISQKKIYVIYEAIDFNRFTKGKVPLYLQIDLLKSLNLENKNYLLTVGHVEPRKNYDRLIIAYLKLKSDYKISEKLVIVGQKHFSSNLFEMLIKEKNNDVIYLNFVDEELLLTLYENAKLFIFPSYYEGFGFPPLEAASFGIPSVVSNVSSIPEICGNGAIYFYPFDVDDISNKIYNILNNSILYNQIKKNAINNLKRFSWHINAKKTIEIYNSFKIK